MFMKALIQKKTVVQDLLMLNILAEYMKVQKRLQIFGKKF